VDRMILFNTDMRSFGASVMENAPESERISSESQSENSSQEESGNGEAEQDNGSAETDNETSHNFIVDWLAAEEAPEPNVCQSGILSVALSKQAYVNGGTLTDSGELRADSVSRTTLLGFSLQDVPPTAASAYLEMTVGADNGHGTLMLGLGSHNDWQPGQSADNVPDMGVLINEYAGAWESGNRHALPIDASLLNDETVSIVLLMQSGANDISIVAGDDSQAPTLVLSGDDSFCEQYNTNRSAREAASESSTESLNKPTNSEATDTDGTKTDTGTNTEIVTVTEAEAETASKAFNGAGSGNGSGSGALTLLSGVLLLVLVLLRLALLRRSMAIRELLR